MWRIGLGLEKFSTPVEQFEWIDDAGTKQPLSKRHLVLRRLTRRLTDPSRVVEIKRSAEQLTQRLERFGLEISWVDVETLNDRGMSFHLAQNQRAACFGISLAASPNSVAEAAGRAAISHHIPFACWELLNWNTPDDDEQLRNDLDKVRCAGDLFSGLHTIKKASGFDPNHYANKLAFIWDDPDRNPHALKFPVRR